MQKKSGFKREVQYRIPTVEEYQQLRRTTGWSTLADEVVETALSNSLFSVCVLHKGTIIGTGRVIGDGGAYFYIQDVIVLPAYQKMGVGLLIMEAVEDWLKKQAPPNAFIGLMAAAGVKRFYKKFGYQVREAEKPGMYKTVLPNNKKHNT